MLSGKQISICYDTISGEITRQEANLKVIQESSLSRQIESNVVGIYPTFTFQRFEGYGCAMTESSCWLLSQMKPDIRQEALKTWFGPEGMDARFVRMHIDSCDYSLEEYQSVADPIADPELATFNIERDKKWVIPIMKEAMELAGHPISVILSPWSPPYQWKTPPELTENDMAVYGGMGETVDFTKPGRCFGGRLKPEYYSSWAKYLVKFIQAYLAEGIHVTMLSVQNEANAATNWDSCLWSGEQEKIFLRDYLYPAMKEAGLVEKIGIYIWDHNKERMIEHIDDMMDDDIYNMIEGFAYHWYSGDHFDALQMLHAKYPDKVLMHSESCGLHIPGKSFAFEISEERFGQMPEDMRAMLTMKDPRSVDFADAKKYAHDIIGDLNKGMQRFIDWNMIVDRTGGPRHVAGGFAAPLIYEEDGTFSRTISFEYLCRIAHIIRPNALRIGCSVFGREVEAAAVKNADGKVGVLLLNQTDEEQHINIRFSGYVMEAVLAPQGLSSVEIG